MAVHRGFILQPTYRIAARQPVVHLYGVLDDGRSFLVRDRRPVPGFYVETRQAEAARALGAARQAPTALRTLAGAAVTRVDVTLPSDTPPLRDRLAGAGIASFEADVRFAMRYLIDRGLRGAVSIEAEGRETPGLGLVFDE